MKNKVYKEEYYKTSNMRKLPLRCPIIGRCERYAQTILYLSELNLHGEGKTIEEKLNTYGYLSDDYNSKKVNQIGEPFKFSKTPSTCTFSKACPEVSLFDNEMVFSFIPQKAITSGHWDKFWSDKIFEVDNLGHFSECPEFSHYHYENKYGPTKRQSKARNVGISKKMRFEVFQKDNFTCQYCGRNKDEDKIKLQLDHIIPLSKGGTDEFSNLTTSCEDCNQGKSNKII